MTDPKAARTVLAVLSVPERLRRWVAGDTTGAILMLLGAALGLAWANSPWHGAYEHLSAATVGPQALHLHLSLSAWASDGLLAVFFFVVGLELKYEAVVGSLRHLREAAVPVCAAIGGMLTPAGVFAVTVTTLGARSQLHGWAIPTATDIAFALAVLTIFGQGLPHPLRTFLLTLAVVDDLLAIIVIAIFYTDHVTPLALAAALGCVGAFAALARSPHPYWWALVPIGIGAWGLMHACGVHPTIAGVLLGLSVPARPLPGESAARTIRLGVVARPFSNLLALPLFAFFAAGVSLVGAAGPRAILTQPVVAAVVMALTLGKPLGVLGTTALVTRLTPLRLPGGLGLRELLPVGLLTGIGFTVSLLIAELSFPDSEHITGARIAILIGTFISAAAAAILLRRDARSVRAGGRNVDGAPDRGGTSSDGSG